MSKRLMLTIATVFVLSYVAAYGQVAPGIPTLSSVGGGEYDIINLATLHIVMQFPVRNKIGPIPFAYSITLDTILRGGGSNGSWFPLINLQNSVSRMAGASSTFRQMPCALGGVTNYYDQWIITDATGAQHPVPGALYDSKGCFTATGGTTADGSGYTLVFTGSPPVASVYDRSGNHTFGCSVTDPNGNVMSCSTSSDGSTSWFDPLGGVLLTTSSTSTQSTYSYTYNALSNQATIVRQSIPTNFQTAYHCSLPSDQTLTGILYPTTISNPDGSVFTLGWEPTSPGSQNTTGRIQSMKLPTGGTISYAYSGGTNGVNCSDGSTPTLKRTTPDGTWTYTHTPPPSGSTISTTSVTDPSGNLTSYTFSGNYETQRLVYQLTNGSQILAETIQTCYNGNFSGCATAAVTSPISRVDQYVTPANGAPLLNETFYNTYGLKTQENFFTYGINTGSAPTGTPVKAIKTTYAAPSQYVHDRPSCIQITTGASPSTCGTVTSNTAAITSYLNYDADANPGIIKQWVSGSTYLTRSFTYNVNGTIASSTDVNNAVTNYHYDGVGGCGNLLVTSTVLPVNNLSTNQQWDCDGGVLKMISDFNGKTTTYSYNDPLWRVTSVMDAFGNVTNYTYCSFPYPTCYETSLTFNNGASTVDNLTTLDNMGRVSVVQRRQAPGNSNFDSVQYAYQWTPGIGFLTSVSVPYLGTSGQLAPNGTAVTTTQRDSLGRPKSVTDGGSGITSYQYTNRDVLVSQGPQSKQLEYDSLGRVRSVCEITSAPGSGSCSQVTAASGYLTTYGYDALGNLTSVNQNAQGSPVQMRTYAYDGLGRLTTETNPESGTRLNVWDSTLASSCGAAQTFNGDLVRAVDANSTNICYSYDGLHRITDVGTNRPSTDGCRRFRYDNTQGVTGAIPPGINITNTMGRLVEAETDNCSQLPPTSGTISTDEWSSYDADGRKTDFYSSTLHSNGYYHVTASYWPNGRLHTLSGVGLPTITYGVNGEGRPNTVSASSGVNPVSATTYNNAGQVTDVSFGSGDPVHFGFDPNTGRMTQYKLTINGTATHGDPTWNPNGTLASLVITDSFNPSDAQACNYGYDDLARLASVNCGTAIWQQNFTYDPFGNITKSGSISWQPGYNQSTNQYLTLANCAQTGTAPCYDPNGNLLKDGTDHVYTWDAYGDPVTLDSETLLYDALGREVEVFKGGGYTEFVFGPTGKLALMNGQTQTKAFLPLPGKTQVKYAGNAISTYRLPDWLGSLRVGSNPNRTYSWGVAFAPFGEMYAQGGVPAWSFTGEEGTADTVSDEYDFLARKLHSSQGRWISPDPAGQVAAAPSNPQSWNRYSYVQNNPLNATDPLGLACYPVERRLGLCNDAGGIGSNVPFGSDWDEFDFLTHTVCGREACGTWINHNFLNSFLCCNDLGHWAYGGIYTVKDLMSLTIRNNNVCADAFGGQQNAENLLNHMTIYQVPSPYTGPFTDAYNSVTSSNNGEQPGWKDAAVTAWFGNPWDGSQYGTFVGNLYSNASQGEQATMLFHEMSHPFNPTGNSSDEDNQDGMYTPYGNGAVGGISAICGTPALPPNPQ